jgi:hypothetical protein
MNRYTWIDKVFNKSNKKGERYDTEVPKRVELEFVFKKKVNLLF